MKNKRPSFSLKALGKVQIPKSSNNLNKLGPLTLDQILLPSYIQSKRDKQ
jgi:hypothetical protein